jgi:hypothetical protein
MFNPVTNEMEEFHFDDESDITTKAQTSGGLVIGGREFDDEGGEAGVEED